MLIKAKEFEQSDNDIYYMEILSDKIIINDNYEGILILDNNLDLIKKLNIFDGITVYSSFVNNINEEVLLFCPDNDCIVYINLLLFEYKVIYGLEDLVFSDLYEWNENDLVLTKYKESFYKIHIKEKIIERIDNEVMDKLYPKLYGLYQESKKQNVVKVFPSNYIAIKDNEKQDITIFDYRAQMNQVFNNFAADFLDIEYREGRLAVINENLIEIITSDDKDILHSDESYIFLKAKFLNKIDNIYLITLSSRKSDCNYSKIAMFQLCIS